MMSKIKKIMGVVLSLVLVFSMFAVAPASAEEAASTETALEISSVYNSAGWYSSENLSTVNNDNVEMNPLHDNDFGKWVQWDASSSSGVQLDIALSALSTVSRIELYVGIVTNWSNTSRINSQYSAIPITAEAYVGGSDWSVVTEKQTYTSDGALTEPVIAQTSMSSTNTDSNLQVISIHVDGVLCDSLSLTLAAAGGALDESGNWIDANKTTRMAVAEIVIYGEDDVLRDSVGNAICTVETNRNTAKGYSVENMMDNDSSDATASDLTRWRATRPSAGGTATELIFRLDGVYNINGFRASEYWQSKNQVATTFKDVDLYVGNTTGAATEWTQIADGLTFNVAAVAGHSHNIISGSAHKGDSLKMVINGVDFSGEDTRYSTYNMLSDVRLYGLKTDDALSGTTMRYLEMASSNDTENYEYIAATAKTVTLKPAFSGIQPSAVVTAAYDADGKLVGVASGAVNEELSMDISGTISFVKIFGWSDMNSLVPVSTTFSRNAVK